MSDLLRTDEWADLWVGESSERRSPRPSRLLREEPAYGVDLAMGSASVVIAVAHPDLTLTVLTLVAVTVWLLDVVLAIRSAATRRLGAPLVLFADARLASLLRTRGTALLSTTLLGAGAFVVAGASAYGLLRDVPSVHWNLFLAAALLACCARAGGRVRRLDRELGFARRLADDFSEPEL